MAASYPTAAKTFTIRTTGDNIQPSFVNGLQDEVVAIEQALLAGGANIHSSGSTVANLSVPGGSTLVGSPTFAGNCTIVGTLTANKIVSTSIATTPTFASFAEPKYQTSTVNTIMERPAGWSDMPFSTHGTDLSSEWDVASTGLTFRPASSGYYFLRLCVYGATVSIGWMFGGIMVGGSSGSDTTGTISEMGNSFGASAGYNHSEHVMQIAKLESTSVVRFKCYGHLSTWRGDVNHAINNAQAFRIQGA